MAPATKKQGGILATLRALGLSDAEVRKSGNAAAIRELEVEAEQAKKAAIPQLKAVDEQAKTVLPTVEELMSVSLQERAELASLSSSELAEIAPNLVAVHKLMVVVTTGGEPAGSNHGGNAHLAWSLLAGLDPKWIAIAGHGKTGMAKQASVYYIDPAASQIQWRTSSVKAARVISHPFSQTGRVRPSDAAAAAVADSYGIIAELADSLDLTEEALVDIAHRANVKYIDLGDLGDPEGFTSKEEEAAFKARDITSDFITL